MTPFVPEDRFSITVTSEGQGHVTKRHALSLPELLMVFQQYRALPRASSLDRTWPTAPPQPFHLFAFLGEYDQLNAVQCHAIDQMIRNHYQPL